uniref:Uncharacterized protein n=1 Tax=Nelumbo nucifera TaxID=4432 RepID=A0A822YJ88_NELNU|nr:TPA_asm: hypothetical protein HUJ06_004894 [Nelumbo nucifera]
MKWYLVCKWDFQLLAYLRRGGQKANPKETYRGGSLSMILHVFWHDTYQQTCVHVPKLVWLSPFDFEWQLMIVYIKIFLSQTTELNLHGMGLHGH